jgi:hypothetical protein
LAFLDQLAAFTNRLGREIAARRIGIAAATLARWIGKGVPQHSPFLHVAALAVGRHEASLRAAETRRKRAPELARIRSALPEIPQREYRAGENAYLDRSELVPRKAPSQSPQVREAQRTKHRGAKGFVTDRYEGETQWVDIGRPIQGVTAREIVDRVSSTYLNSGRSAYNVRFLFLRYVPFNNPYYRGNLLRNRGEWVTFWEQTPIRFEPDTVDDVISVIFDGVSYGDKHIVGVRELSESRVVFLESYEIRTFDDLEEAPSAESVFRRPLF